MVSGKTRTQMLSEGEIGANYGFKSFEGKCPSLSDTETESSDISDCETNNSEEKVLFSDFVPTECAKYEKVGITVMHESNEAALDIVEEFGGRLTSELDLNFLERLKSQTPEELGSARVADFNENLSYAMSPERGLRTAFCRKNGFLSNSDESLIDDFEHLLCDVIGRNVESACKPNDLEYQGSFMRTEGKTIAQPPHVDFDWSYLEDSTIQANVFLAFFPLTKQGCFVQIWPEAGNNELEERGKIIFIPFGTLLMLPCDTIHGGGFRSHSDCPELENGNLRFHLYIACNDVKLPRFQKNRYTMKYNPGRELSEQYVDAPILHSRPDALSVFE